MRRADEELAGGKGIEDVCRSLEIRPATYHRWAKKYAGAKLDTVKRLKEPQKENTRLKKLVAEQVRVPSSVHSTRCAPWENPCIESFNSRPRHDLLDVEEIGSLAKANWLAKERRHKYKQIRPHSHLGHTTPAKFAASLFGSTPACGFRYAKQQKQPRQPTKSLIEPGPKSGGRSSSTAAAPCRHGPITRHALSSPYLATDANDPSRGSGDV